MNISRHTHWKLPPSNTEKQMNNKLAAPVTVGCVIASAFPAWKIAVPTKCRSIFWPQVTDWAASWRTLAAACREQLFHFFFFFLALPEKRTCLTLEDLPQDTKNTCILVISSGQLSQGWLVQRTISINDDIHLEIPLKVMNLKKVQNPFSKETCG